MAEWLGTGLQNPLHRFEPGRCLQHKNTMTSKKKPIKRELLDKQFWEFSAYYSTAVVIENILSVYLGNLVAVITACVVGLQLYLINKVSILKQFTFQKAFQFSLLISLVGGLVAGIINIIMRYTIAKNLYEIEIYNQLKTEYEKLGLGIEVTNQVFNFISNPFTIFVMFFIGGAIYGSIVGLVVGFIAKSRLAKSEEDE